MFLKRLATTSGVNNVTLSKLHTISGMRIAAM